MLRKQFGIYSLIGVLLLTLTGIGCSALLDAKEVDPEDGLELIPEPPSEQTEIILYFADWQAQHVMPERRQVNKVDLEGLSEAIVEELVRGPADPHLNATLPKATEVISVEIEGETVYVSLSKEVTGVYGSAGEMMAVRSIVYSLTERPDIEQVQILIEGKRAESLSGHTYLEQPMDRSPIVTDPVFVDEERAASLQSLADANPESLYLDPVEVARFDGRMAGFEATDTFTLRSIDEASGEAVVEAERGDEIYALQFEQPVRKGEGGIWVITAVTEE